MSKNKQSGEFPRVTVITVVYNLIEGGREEYFRQCLQSVHEQMYGNIEHIVIDGASTDGTIELLEEYRRKGWIRYYSEPDRGVYDAMNKGAEKASGKYITFLNSDDFFNNEMAIAISVKKIEEECSDFSCGTARIIDKGKEVALIRPQLQFFMLCTPFCHQTVLMRRDVFIKEHGFNTEKYRLIADHDLIVRMLLKGYLISVIDEDLVSYRWGGMSGETDLSGELSILQKEYFPKLIKATKHQSCSKSYNTYEINLNELKKTSSKVCSRVRHAISHLNFNHDKSEKGFAKVVLKKYFSPATDVYKVFGIPVFSVDTLDFPSYSRRKAYRMFSIKLFEIKNTPNKREYRVLYTPVLTIKHN